MRKAIFSADPKKGFIASTLAPVKDKHEARFGLVDLVLFLGLVIGGIAMMRYFIAH